MKKSLLGLVLFLASAFGQTVHTASQENQNTFTGTNQFTKGAILGPVTFANIGTLPASTGNTAFISDGLKGSNPCTAGGTGAQAIFHGGQWDCAGGGGTLTGVTAGTGLTGGGNSGTVTLNVANPNPTGVAVGSNEVSNGVGQPPTYQIKYSVNVRDKGVDCTGLTDSSAALNTLFTAINGVHVTADSTCMIRVDHQLLIFGQSGWDIEGSGFQPGTASFAGPTIFGCGVTSGVMIYVNRSGYGRIHGFNLLIHGASSPCTSSGFTTLIESDNNNTGGGVTGHDIYVYDNYMTTAVSGGAVANFIGMQANDVSGNGEGIFFRDNYVHCQNSSNSMGFDATAPGFSHSDWGVIDHNKFSNCAYGVNHGAGNYRITRNLFSNTANFSVFGANAANIFLGGCVSGPVLIEGNQEDSGGKFISSGGVLNAGCAAGENIFSNFIGAVDMNAGEYTMELGSAAGVHNVIGNQFFLQTTTNQYLVGSAVNGANFGPLGYLYDSGNGIRTPTETNTLGFSSSVYPFQGGEYHGTTSRYPYASINPTQVYGPNGNTPNIDTVSMVRQAGPINVTQAQQSPTEFFRSWTASAFDDWGEQTVSTSTNSERLFGHVGGSATTLWNVSDGQTSGLTVVSLSTPGAPSINIVGGTGATTYSYCMVVYSPNGNTVCGTTATTNTGPATLTSTNYNQIQWFPIYGAIKYCFRRTAGGGSSGLIGCVSAAGGTQNGTFVQAGGTQYIFNDIGLVGDGSSAPAANTTGIVQAATFQDSNSHKLPFVLGAGATALNTAAISSTNCNTTTQALTGLATTDTIIPTAAADWTGVTGYIPATTGILTLYIFPTTNTINFKVCNMTSSTITPAAASVNWLVIRSF